MGIVGRNRNNIRGDAAILFSLGVSLMMLGYIGVLQIVASNKMRISVNNMNSLDSYLSNEIFAWHGFLKKQAENSSGREIAEIPSVYLNTRSSAFSMGAKFCGTSANGLDKVCIENSGGGGATIGSWQTLDGSAMPPTKNAGTFKNRKVILWTGKEIIQWGGDDGRYSLVNDGEIIDPDTNTYRPMSVTNAPYGYFSAIWAGDRMILIGGKMSSSSMTGSSTCSGFTYDPIKDTWTEFTGSSAIPDQQICWDTRLVWTGTKLISLNSTAVTLHSLWQYDPAKGTWTQSRSTWMHDPITNSTIAPENGVRPPDIALGGYSIVWSGNKMLVWGGAYNMSLDSHWFVQQGAAYDPATDTWQTISTKNAPTARGNHIGLSMGNKMIIWGGMDKYAANDWLNDGAIYDPSSDTWSPISNTNAPKIGYNGLGVWTGEKMIIWGGTWGGAQTGYVYSGGIYDPKRNTWDFANSAGSPAGLPTPDRAIWVKNRMYLWDIYPGSNTNYITNPYVFFPNITR